MNFAALLETLNSVIWSPALVFLCLAVGVYFTLTTLFLQVRCLPDMMRQIVSNKKSGSGVSSFESLMISLAGRGYRHCVWWPGGRVLDVGGGAVGVGHVVYRMHARPDL